MDKVALLEEYEQEIGKPGTEWGSQEVQAFFTFLRWKMTRV